MIIAIDGPAGSGKSTLAKALAKTLGYAFLDTGAMYRCITLACLNQGVDLNDTAAISDIADSSTIAFEPSEDTTLVFLDGVDVTKEIRTPKIDKNVSKVAAVAHVREVMMRLQRRLAQNQNVVAEGRDMGTVVFPNAEVKVFLTANPEARALRRAVQQAGGDIAKDNNVEVSDEIKANILEDLKRRDEIDSSREVAPLKPADDAHFIDSSALTVEQEVQEITKLVDQAQKASQASEKGDCGCASKTDATEKKADKAPVKKTRKTIEPMKMFGNSSDSYPEHPMRQYPWHAKLVVAISAPVVWAYTKLLWPWKIENADKILEATKDKGAVVVMNHGSMLDPLPVILYMYFKGRHLRPIYKSEFRKLGIARWFFNRMGGIAVQRGTADITAIRRAERSLKDGDSILIFPEGTRVKRDEDSVVHGGFALIAQRAAASVVPVAIVGARDITPKGKHLGKPGRVYLKVGDAITFDSLGDLKRKEQVKAMETKAMDEVFSLRDQLREEHPGKM